MKNWLKNLKISQKIILFGSIVSIFTFLIASLLILQLFQMKKEMDSLYKDRVTHMKQLKEISDMYTSNIINNSYKVKNNIITWKQGLDGIKEAQTLINSNIENYEKTFLTEDELAMVENLEIKPDKKKFHHRNMYIFSAYTGGLRISDVMQLKWEHFDGERILLKTQKTGSVISIKVPTKALAMLDSYKTPDSKPSDFIFPVLKNDIDYSDPVFLHNTISSMNAYINKHIEIQTFSRHEM